MEARSGSRRGKEAREEGESETGQKQVEGKKTHSPRIRFLYFFAGFFPALLLLLSSVFFFTVKMLQLFFELAV